MRFLRKMRVQDIVVEIEDHPAIRWTYCFSGFVWMEGEMFTIERVLRPYMHLMVERRTSIDWMFEKRPWGEGDIVRYAVDSRSWNGPMWDSPFDTFVQRLHRGITRAIERERMEERRENAEVFV